MRYSSDFYAQLEGIRRQDQAYARDHSPEPADIIRRMHETYGDYRLRSEAVPDADPSDGSAAPLTRLDVPEAQRLLRAMFEEFHGAIPAAVGIARLKCARLILHRRDPRLMTYRRAAGLKSKKLSRNSGWYWVRDPFAFTRAKRA
jgi:hypothetical protein